jgi:hypothetical protein
VLCEVAYQHVPSRPRDAGAADLVGGELPGETPIQPGELLEGAEHLGVARRVRAAAGDHVGAVLAVLTDGPEELAALDERVADAALEVARRGSGQFVSRAIDGQENRFALARNGVLTVRELDQELWNSASCTRRFDGPGLKRIAPARCVDGLIGGTTFGVASDEIPMSQNRGRVVVCAT